MGVVALSVHTRDGVCRTAGEDKISLRVTTTPINSNLVEAVAVGGEGSGIKRGPMPSETHSKASDAKTSSALGGGHLRMFPFGLISRLTPIYFTLQRCCGARLYAQPRL